MAKKVKVVKEGPLYPGEPVLVKWSFLKKQSEDEQPLGCLCVCTESGAKGKSRHMGLGQKGNLIAAMKHLLNSKAWLEWVLDKATRSWCTDYCDYCGGEVYVGLRVSEDWCVEVCEICKTKSWGSTYKPPRRPPPFEFMR